MKKYTFLTPKSQRINFNQSKHVRACPKTEMHSQGSGFGERFTPHVLEVDWSAIAGWSRPRFVLQRKGLYLSHSASSLQYALSCFEGMKAHASRSGKALLFRPHLNAQRFVKSCKRLALPSIHPEDFLRLVRMSVRQDAKHIPKQENAALYIRPTMISTEASLRIGPPRRAKLFILLSPVRSYFDAKHDASLLVDRRFLRAWPKGTGSLKLACNYAPTVLPLQYAHKKKCIQNLCLGPNDEITEAGSMNIFFVVQSKDRGKYVITPPVDDLVLPGVVRSSVLSLLKKFGFKVIVERISLKKILKGISSRRIVECFGCGTACTITPIHIIQCDGKKYQIPKARDPISFSLLKRLRDIQYGERKSRWAVPV